MNDFDKARQKYKPQNIKLLFIAEAPPKLESERFFYYENVTKQDSLFWEMMKVLYLDDTIEVKEYRGKKYKYLEQFKDSDYYLIDASPIPIKSGMTKKRQLESFLSFLVEEVNGLVNKKIPVILISATVHQVCYAVLKEEGFNILNDKILPFPGQGHQKKFRDQLRRLLKQKNA
jgi:hypothetical protein